MRAGALALLLAAGPPPAQPAAPAPQRRVLTLDEAIGTARTSQPQLRQARAGAEAAEARADEARAPLLPQLGASAGYELTTANAALKAGSTGTRPPSSFATYDYWNASATLSQLVWDFGQTTGRWNAATASAAAQRDSERATSIQVLLSVRAAFFAARAAKDLVTVARETLANQEAHLKQTEGFVAVGRQPEIALAQARTDRANSQVQLINAENGYEVAKAQLNQAMGVEGPTDYQVADDTLPPVAGEDGPVDGLLAEALSRRPDVAALDAQARAQRATLGSVRGAWFPAIGASTTISDAGPALDRMAWNWNASATLTWNLFQGGLTAAQTREAQANLDSLLAQGVSIRQQVRLEVEQARLAVRAAKAALSATGEALSNARQRLRLAEGRFQVGAGSIIELSDAQVAATSAAAQRVQADYNLATARAQMLKALGRPAREGAQP